MSFIISPNMQLSIPTVGQEAGPQYAFDVNTSLTLIDSHDHSPGKGVSIPSAGININSALPFSNNSATGLASVQFNAQPSFAALRSIYVISQDLYYNDGAGNIIQITSGGNVNAPAATIPGQSFAANTFIWKQGAGSTTPADFDIGSVIIRPNIALTTNGVKVSPPSGISSAYTINLPPDPSALPAPGFLQIASTGAITQTISTDHGISVTNQKVRPVSATAPIDGILQTPSSASFSTISTSPVAVTNLSGTLVTGGRPIRVELNSASTSNGSGYIGISNAGAGIFRADFKLLRDGTPIANYTVEGFTQSGVPNVVPAASVAFIDNVAAGTYTYSVTANTNGGGSSAVLESVYLTAYEL